ncbi:hypothetical protein KR084_007680 [Drosophila pseudotakahashii]|nr:hypothetical protein KR084_007680 [Drosophila pseudotakahashii]
MSAKNPSSIQVCIKIRPCEPELTSLWQVNDGRSIHLADSHAEPYVFDYVFDEGTNNQEVFDRMAKHIVHACMQGFNGTIFAYGQTSSGKTYTMMGDGQNPGVMVLAAKEIFQQISSEKERDFLLRVGYIEIYNEKIYDLLNKKNQDLKIHESGNGIVNVNCEECIITSEDDLLRLLCMGNKERTVGETNMNERSSRSHAIFRIIIESRKSDRSDDDAVIQSVLNLVDLAGSERADQTGARGARLKEGGHINKSLLFLSNVIKSLSENMDNKFISFRDSKLTRILQGSLCGNALTSIICTIKPSIMEESQSTLSFATRAKKVRIKPQVNEMVSDATMMKRLGREIQVLKDKLAEAERKNESQLKVQDLEQRIQRDMHKIISSTSLSDKCQQKRRRTWCPAPSGPVLESEGTAITDDRLLQFSKVSHLPKPVFFSNTNVGKRWDNIPKTINILGTLDIGTEATSINEEFFPAECIDFGSPRPGFQKDMLTSGQLPDLTLTPLTRNTGPLSLEKIKEIQDLQMFTSIEKHCEEESKEVQVLKEKLIRVTADRDKLEQDSLTEKERYDALQEEVSSLTTANEAANARIGELEQQLSSLKETMTRLEVENREAVSLEFEFEAHKKTSKLRVNDLLSALSEKDLAIESLQKSLDNLTRNINMQAEIKTRNEREEEAHSSEPLVEKFKAENQELKAKLSALETNFDEIQREYDCLSNQLLESVQENDAMREELKQRQTSFDMESMKSSGVGTDCSDLDSELLEQFVKMSESVQQIELQHHSGFSRLFRAHKLEKDERVPGLKLCLESAEYIEGDTRQPDTSDSICLKGFLKRHRFHIMRLSEEQLNVGEEKRLLDIISQLEQEVDEKNVLMEATEATINEMRDQMTSLESALLEKSVIVNKVEDYQRQIESLEKQNAEMTMVYEELQDRVIRENSMSDSLLKIPPDEDTLPGFSASPARKDQESQEVANLKASLAELRAKLCDMQAEMDSQLTQMHLKDENIAKLQTDFEEMSERCLSMEVRLAELEVDTQQKQEQLDRQAQKLSDDLRIIDQLQERNAQLAERSIKAEGSSNVAEANHEYHSQIEELGESLRTAKEELCDFQRIKMEEMNALEVEFLLKMEANENENRAKLRASSLELEESKNLYESIVAALKEQLSQAGEELASVTARYQAELQGIQSSLQEKITKAEEERINLTSHHQAEVESIREKLADAEAQQSKIEDAYKAEISNVTSALKEELSQAMEAQEKALLKLDQVRNTLEEMINCRTVMAETIAELEKTKAEQDLALDELKREKIQLEALYVKSQEYLQMQSLTRDLNSSDAQTHSDLLQESSNEKLNALQLKCEQYVLDLDKLRQEKVTLQSEIQNANAQHSSTLEKLQELETEMAALSEKKELEKCDLEDKLETFNAKITDLEEALQGAQLKVLAHDDLLAQHESLKTRLSELHSEMLSSQERLSTRDVEIAELRSELKQVMDAKITVSSEQLCLVEQLKEVEKKMSSDASKFQIELEDLKGSLIELQLKLKSLQEIKDNLQTENDELKEKLKNGQNLQSMLEKEQKLCASLRESFDQVEQSKISLETKLQASEAEFNQKASELSREVELGRNRIGELTKESEKLRSDLKEKKSLELSVSDQQNMLEERQNLCTSLKENLEKLEKSKTNLEQQMQDREAEIKLRIGELTNESEKLRSDLKSKEASFHADKERMDGTISSLLEEKRNLEEKLCTVNDIVAKLEAELATLQTLKKSVTSESEERKNRRISIHDERRQSYWNDSRDCGTMTDPPGKTICCGVTYKILQLVIPISDKNCNCAELNCKLQDCQRDLFIRESQVTALTMELKHHPLKDENAQLKKRVQEEQEKARSEQKRLKIKIHDLNTRINDHTAALSVKSADNKVTIVKPAMVPAETQTESELEAVLEKTNMKYQDACLLLRSRYNLIKNLEEQLKQKENHDTSNISSLQAGQNSALKSQCESQKRELTAIKTKYESAKRVLMMRKDELDKMREKLATYEGAK